ncbi:MFS transporter [Actinacidiphila rubida]|uniref:MFS transporter n=1 Tax=Actinacidiphila rubida TaxID=310780 RepID=UPI002244F632|nr:MFS transporter [Actinacidiphila rubida]
MWRDADFRRLWAGQAVSQLGEHASLVIVPLFAVVTLHASAGQLGVLRAVGQAPVLLLSLPAGAWVDRWRARTAMAWADAGRALVLAGAAVAGWWGSLAMGALLVVVFAAGALSVVFDVAYQAAVVRLVERDRLVAGNSALEGSRSAAQIAGPALGGALVSLLSVPVAAAAGALSFAVSFLSLRRIRRPEPVPERAGDAAGAWRRMGRGVRFVAGDAALRAVCVASAAYQFSFAAMMTVYLLFLPRQLHLPGVVVGVVLAASGPGALAGSLLAARAPARFGYGVVLVGGAALGDGVFCCVPALHGPPVVVAGVLVVVGFVFGLGAQLVNVTVMAVRQAVTPPAVQGRTAATISFVGMGMAPLGSLLGGFLAHAWGLRAGLMVAAVAMLVSPAVMALSPLGRLGRVLPAPVPVPLARASAPVPAVPAAGSAVGAVPRRRGAEGGGGGST